jgi:ATP-binding cassette subfamily B multidrug efflux pump
MTCNRDIRAGGPSWPRSGAWRYDIISNAMLTYRALRGYMLRYWPILVVGLFFIIAANLVALVPAFLIQQVIDGLGRHMTMGALLRYALAIVGVGVAAGALQFLSRYTVQRVSRRVEYDLRSDLFRHFQRLELEYFQNAKLGDLVARATNDLSAIRMMLGGGITNLCNAVVALIVTAVAMVTINLHLALYALSVMPLITILFIVLRRRIQQRFRRVQDQFGIVSARAQENFSGIRVVKAYVQEQYELESFNRANQDYLRMSIAFARLNALLWPSMYAISGLAVAILLWRGGIDVITGRIQLGQLVRFNVYLVALSWPMIALGWTFNLFQQGSASMGRVREVMERPPAIADRFAAGRGGESYSSRQVSGREPGKMPDAGMVEFEHVSLAYGDYEALHDISFQVPAGTSLAIVGPTGAGKTSIVNLIPRIYDVTAGRVLVDGVDVREIPLAALRRAIGYVPQETFLFGVTIAENVGFGVEQLDEARLAHAMEVSQLSRDIDAFPQGVATMVGERGVTLSGGQKQRAGIARAVARDPLILILDDALSSVDTNTEAAILKGLRQVMAGRTAIVIGHRISTIKDMDQIIVIDGGRIVARGTHETLIAHGGLYASMYRRQLLSEEMADDEGSGDTILGINAQGTDRPPTTTGRGSHGRDDV